MRLNIVSLACLTMAASCFSSFQVHAEEFKPAIHGLILFEAEDDWAFDSDDSDAEVNTLTGTVEPYFILSLTDRLAVETTLVLEQVQDTDPGEDTYFDNEGMYVEQLMLSYTDDHYSLYAGKFEPGFGTAWDLAPGVYSADFAEDYELAERIGLGGSYSVGEDETGEYTLSAAAFFADTTFLSDSTITRRGNLDEDDGGVSNTEDLSSYVVSLDGENIFGIGGLNVNFGYRNQSEGDADVGLDREAGYVAGANYTFPVNENVEATLLAEWAGIRNLDGGDDDVNYLTTSLGLTVFDNWNFAASYTGRDTNVAGGADIDDSLYQFSAGYAFENGVTIDAGYSNREESDVETSIAGVLVGYTYEF